VLDQEETLKAILESSRARVLPLPEARDQREIPSSKIQTPNERPISKSQALLTDARWVVGSLEFLLDLDLGIWNLTKDEREADRRSASTPGSERAP
jgi:hypothetical protein